MQREAKNPEEKLRREKHKRKKKVNPIARRAQRRMMKQRRTHREANTGTGTLVRVDQVERKKMTRRRRRREGKNRAKATQGEQLENKDNTSKGKERYCDHSNGSGNARREQPQQKREVEKIEKKEIRINSKYKKTWGESNGSTADRIDAKKRQGIPKKKRK